MFHAFSPPSLSKFEISERSAVGASGPLSTEYFRLRLGSLADADQRVLTGNYVYLYTRRLITLVPQISLICEEFQPSFRSAMSGLISVLQFREERHSREMSVAARPSTVGERGVASQFHRQLPQSRSCSRTSAHTPFKLPARTNTT